MTDDFSDEFPLHLRLAYSGPRKLEPDDQNLRLYFCTYCFHQLKLYSHEIRLCQSPECIRQAITDRQNRIFELQLAIPKAHIKLLKERKRVVSQIRKLEKNGESLALVQYRSVLNSLDLNLGFYAKNDLDDQIIEINSQIRDLSRRLRRPSFSEESRRTLFLRDEGRCYLCKLKIVSWTGEAMHIDHVNPRSQGGSDESHNLRIAHAVCN